MKKMNMKKTLLAACTALAPLLASAQADIHFSQFYETSILRNPALTGIFTNDYKFGGYYRSQWSSISHPYVTGLGDAEMRFPVNKTSEDYLSLGLLGYADRAGSVDQSIVAFYPAINYSKSVNPERSSYFSMGITGGYVQYSFDPSKATFDNQFQFGAFDPNNPSMENITSNKMTMWDLGAGVNYNTTGGPNNNVTYIMGVSGYHFTQPRFSYNPSASQSVTENIRLNANGAIAFDINRNVTTQMQVNYAQQGTYTEIIGGALFTWQETTLTTNPLYSLTCGLLYRYQDAIIPVVKMKYKNSAIGVSYDVNVSTLKAASNLRGGAEVSIFIGGNFYDKNGVLRKTVCPKF